MVKNMIFFPRMLILIAQKKRLGALNATQKNHSSLPSTVTEKFKKNLQKLQISQKMSIFGTIGGFS